jgi:hypothetical protein
VRNSRGHPGLLSTVSSGRSKTCVCRLWQFTNPGRTASCITVPTRSGDTEDLRSDEVQKQGDGALTERSLRAREIRRFVRRSSRTMERNR